MDQTSDSGWTASNFLGEMRQIMTRYDFLLHRQVILSNVRTDSTLKPNFTYQLFLWIGVNNDQMYDLLGTRRVILNNFQTDSNLT